MAFGCGANAGLMVSGDEERRRQVVAAALDAGFNLFDTAPAYGDGASERHLGRALADVDVDVRVFTKVSLGPAELSDVKGAVIRSVHASLERLGRRGVAGVTLHNRIARHRDVERRVGIGPLLTVADVLGPNGVCAAFDELRQAGLVEVFGITTLGGDRAALDEVMGSQRFDYVNAVYGILGELDRRMPAVEGAGSYDPVGAATAHGLGVMALRVLGGGLLLQPGEQQQDAVRALRRWSEERATTLPRVAIRYALSNPDVTTAVIGFAEVAHVRDALYAVRQGPLDRDETDALNALLRAYPTTDVIRRGLPREQQPREPKR